MSRKHIPVGQCRQEIAEKVGDLGHKAKAIPIATIAQELCHPRKSVPEHSNIAELGTFLEN